MKKLLSFLGFLLLSLFFQCAFAESITVDQAKQKALQLWQQKGLRANVDFLDVTPKGQYAGFYILNASDGNGFVIVSADTRALPILGYSTKGSFNVADMPDVVRYWLNAYEQEIALLCQNADESEALLPECYRRSTKSASAVAALMTTTWDQGKYYNAMCPSDNSLNDYYLGGHPYTGCTNTAMAQVMKYWNWPVHGSGSYSYTWEGDPWYNWHYGTLSADFENTYYDWDNMPNELTSSSTQAQIDAVSTLIYHCGVSTQSGYNSDNEGGTGAYVTLVDMDGYGEYCAENALYTFFRYKNTVRGLSKNDYSESDWVEMLKTELSSGRPVIYQGYTGTGWDAYGHCFVLDGYDEQDKFHVNWGWSGDYDAFYALNALRPYSNYNFSSCQEGLFYLEPDRENVDVADFEDEQLFVQGSDGKICVFGAEGKPVQVYDVQGRLVAQCANAQQGEILPVRTTGLYIAKVGKHAVKVVVK